MLVSSAGRLPPVDSGPHRSERLAPRFVHRALGFLSVADSPARLGDDFDPNENLLSHLLRFVERLIQPVSMVTTHKEELNDSELMKDFCLWIDTSEQKYQVSD